MLYAYFEVKNFRGISHTKLDLRTKPHSNIHCLVGLNESGKTTLLEAINYFTYNTDKLTALELKGYSIDDPNTLIPISKRSNYSEKTVISVGLELDDSDESFLVKAVKEETGFQLTEKIGTIKIDQNLEYRDSRYQNTRITWTLRLSGRSGAKRVANLSGNASQRELWNQVINVIKKRIPGILFFPNFLFDFPKKIYLEDGGTDQEKNRFYTNVVQDILDGLNNGTNVETHIVARAKSNESADKASLNQLLLAAARHVSQNVFAQWKTISKALHPHRKITIDHGTEADGRVYLEFNIEDSDGIFSITERSLGFRWFFVFFLLTYYRAHRAQAGSVLFLFDEPASNLHQTAQAQLLETFKKIGKNSQIIYTTHSHHLIDPQWLDSTHIVRNEGLHDPVDLDDFNSSKTQVAVQRYRKFATEHPDQIAYFQPILDVLDYQPSHLEMVPSVVMVEGKSDYYVLRYFQEIVLKRSLGSRFLPGTGSGSLTTLIQLYLAWGRKFLVLLDDDKEGRKQRSRYIGQIGEAVTQSIQCFGDIDSTYSNLEIEDLLSKEDRLLMQRVAYPEDTNLNKTHFQRAVQEALIGGIEVPMSEDAKSRVQRVLEFCEEKLA